MTSNHRVYDGCTDERGHRWVRERGAYYPSKGKEIPEYCDHCGVLWSNVRPADETSELPPQVIVCGTCQRKATVTSEAQFKLLALVCERGGCPGRGNP